MVDKMEILEGFLYTEDHNWVRIEDDVAYVGATDYGQNELEDVVFIDFPEVGKVLKTDEIMVTLESVKTTIDLFMDFTGEVLEINEELLDRPEMINEEPYDSWLMRIEINDRGNLDSLMDSEEYKKFLEEIK